MPIARRDIQLNDSDANFTIWRNTGVALTFGNNVVNNARGYPFTLDDSFDPSRPVSVFIYVMTNVIIPQDGTSLFWRLFGNTTHVGSAALLPDVDLVWPVPPGWTNLNPQLLLFDNGSGFTYPGGTFQSRDLWLPSLQRRATDPLDNHESAVRIPAAVQVQYSLRCAGSQCQPC